MIMNDLRPKRESRNPFSPNFKSRFTQVRVYNPNKKQKTSNNMDRRDIVYG